MTRWRLRRSMCWLGLHVFEWGGHYLVLTHTTRDTRSMVGPQLTCHWCDKTIGQQDVASGSVMESIGFPLGCLLVAAGLAMMKLFHPTSALFGIPILLVSFCGLGLQAWATSRIVRRLHYLKHLTAAMKRKRDTR